MPEPHVSVQESHMDHSAHPTVVVANAVVAIVVAGAVGGAVVVSAPVAVS